MLHEKLRILLGMTLLLLVGASLIWASIKVLGFKPDPIEALVVFIFGYNFIVIGFKFVVYKWMEVKDKNGTIKPDEKSTGLDTGDRNNRSADSL